MSTSIMFKPLVNYAIDSKLIIMVQEKKFGGKDLYAHLVNFLEICNTIKFYGSNDDVIKFRLFAFLLCDKAKIWLNEHEPNTFTTWDKLSHDFMNNYYPTTKAHM